MKLLSALLASLLLANGGYFAWRRQQDARLAALEQQSRAQQRWIDDRTEVSDAWRINRDPEARAEYDRQMERQNAQFEAFAHASEGAGDRLPRRYGPAGAPYPRR